MKRNSNLPCPCCNKTITASTLSGHHICPNTSASTIASSATGCSHTQVHIRRDLVRYLATPVQVLGIRSGGVTLPMVVVVVVAGDAAAAAAAALARPDAAT